MLKSLDTWIETGKDFEVRITCDPRFITKDDLMEIADILQGRHVKNIAIQKYIPHHEEEDNTTTEAERAQFFNDSELRDKINSMFANVVWRE